MSRRRAWALALLFAAATVWQIPHRWCAFRAQQVWDDEGVLALAREVAAQVDSTLGEQDYLTGSDHFNSEWLFGTHSMAAMGFGQIALTSTEDAPWATAKMDACLERLLRPQLAAFDTRRWGRSALSTLATAEGHVAHLGYLNLALSLRRKLGPSNFDEMNDRISSALSRRFEQSATGLLETFPGAIFPVDNAAAIASVALRSKALGGAVPKIAQDWIERLDDFRDPTTGLLIQRVNQEGRAVDAARGSGTTLAAYFLSFMAPQQSRLLFDAVESLLASSVLGFGAIAEYPAGQAGHGDIDSGPLVAGYSISATGFAIAGARIHHRERLLAGLLATTYLFGAPSSSFWNRPSRLTHITGGPLGNSILLAMLTAGRRA